MSAHQPSTVHFNQSSVDYYGVGKLMQIASPHDVQLWATWLSIGGSVPLKPVVFGTTVLALLAPLALFLWRMFVPNLLSSYRHLPGPKQGPALFRMFHEPNIEELELWAATIPNNGLMRYFGAFNRERIYVCTAAATQDLLVKEPYKFVKPELQFILAENISDEGLLLLEGDTHKKTRKMMGPVFNPERVRQTYPSLWRVVGRLNNYMAKEAQVDGTASILKPVHHATIEYLGDWAFSMKMNGLSDPNAALPRSYVNLFKTTWRGQNAFRLAALVGPKLVLGLPLRAAITIKGIMKYVRQTLEEVVTQHEAVFAANQKDCSVAVPDDMVTLLIKSGHFGHKELVHEAVHFMAAATETSCGTIDWVMHLLSRHVDVQTRLRAEIRAHLPNPSTMGDEDFANIARLSHTFDQMPYLNAVVNEAFRFHSINTILWRKCVAPATVAGTSICVGTLLVYSPWAVNRDVRHWGSDAWEFNPERFVKDPLRGGADGPLQHHFLTFGSGPRNCVGENYARAQVRAIVAGLVGKFEFVTMDKEGTDEGTEIGSNYTMTLFKIVHGWKTYVKEVEGW